MKPLTLDVDLAEEVQAIADYLALKWAPRDDLIKLVLAIRDRAMVDARGWIDHYELSHEAHELEKKREALLESRGFASDARYYDAYCVFLDRISFLDRVLRDIGLTLDGPFSFESRVKRLSWGLNETFKGLTRYLPLGWEESLSQNEDDLCEAYSSKADKELFAGTDAQGVMSGTFPWKVALSTIRKGESNGLAPWVELVGAVYGHFLCIAEFLNTRRAVEALKTALPYDAPEMQFALPEQFANPFLQTLKVWQGPTPSELSYQGSVMMRESLKLPEAERAAFVKDKPELVKAYAEGIAQMHARLGSDERNPEVRARMAHEMKLALTAAQFQRVVVFTDGEVAEVPPLPAGLKVEAPMLGSL